MPRDGRASGRLAGLAAAAACIAAIAVGLASLRDSAGPAATMPAIADATPARPGVSTDDTVPDPVADQLATVPEVVALEEEFDDIGDLVELASTVDVSALADEQIALLLF